MAKQSWEMGLMEFGQSRLPDSVATQITEARQVRSYAAQHKHEIKTAIARGDNVPESVLIECGLSN